MCNHIYTLIPYRTAIMSTKKLDFIKEQFCAQTHGAKVEEAMLPGNLLSCLRTSGDVDGPGVAVDQLRQGQADHGGQEDQQGAEQELGKPEVHGEAEGRGTPARRSQGEVPEHSYFSVRPCQEDPDRRGGVSAARKGSPEGTQGQNTNYTHTHQDNHLRKKAQAVMRQISKATDTNVLPSLNRELASPQFEVQLILSWQLSI